ncbi:MAG: hypothetical protein K6L81_12510 [Agarilytica sp.]
MASRFRLIGMPLCIVFSLTACTSEQVYNAMASQQCQRDAEQAPGVNSAKCINEDKIDGKTYREYERDRKK